MARPYLGIPRALIPWAPRIDKDTCIGCGDCLEACANGVFLLDEAAGKMRVAEPDNCVVLCDKCAAMCTQGAITFPDQTKMRTLLRHLVQEQREHGGTVGRAG
jgi:NAD-dependent dihydropyrimidine dehydrogenase PreA subunit